MSSSSTHEDKNASTQSLLTKLHQLSRLNTHKDKSQHLKLKASRSKGHSDYPLDYSMQPDLSNIPREINNNNHGNHPNTNKYSLLLDQTVKVKHSGDNPSDSSALIRMSQKHSNSTKREESHNNNALTQNQMSNIADETPNNNQNNSETQQQPAPPATLKLPPIQLRQLRKLLEAKDDYEVGRANSNSHSTSSVVRSSVSIGSSFLNIKAIAVSGKEHKPKPKLMLYKSEDPSSNSQSKTNIHNSHSLTKQDVSDSVKQDLRKDISAAKNRKKSTLQLKKEKIVCNSVHDFIFFINWTNRAEHTVPPCGSYKAWVGKGNNSVLIKNTFKNRFWWNIVDIPQHPTDANIYWTQSRTPDIINMFPKNIEENGRVSSPIATKGNSPITFEVPRQHQRESNSSSVLNPFSSNPSSKKHSSSFSSTQNQSFGLRKLASSKDLQTCKDGFSVELKPNQNTYKFPAPNSIQCHNHLEFNWNLSNKKALFYNLKTYYEACNENPFNYIPLTFHVQSENDKEWTSFVNCFNARAQEIRKEDISPAVVNNLKTGGGRASKLKPKKQKNVWIIKPGENSNRGCGIDVSDSIESIKEIMKTKGTRPNGKTRTHIIQSYIMPFLYNKRKFDIRCYIVVTSVNNTIKAYWYEEGYIRTSCKQFTLKNLANRMIHLTNDAVQKKSEDYGKFENGNKISFADFQKYLDNTHPEANYSFSGTVYPQMKKLAADAVRSTFLVLDSSSREFSFEVFGLDFMIDQNFNTWLIEVNTNPCLELSSPLLARIIPNMIENAFRIAVDPLFPPPKDSRRRMPNESIESNKFELIFDSMEEGKDLRKVMAAPRNLADVIQIQEEDSEIDDEEEPRCEKQGKEQQV